MRDWVSAQPEEELFISVLALAEIRDGIERLRQRDAEQANRLEAWLLETESHFADRLLPVTTTVADHWGRLYGPQPLPDFDRLIAATAKAHGFTVVTRNTRDFERAGVPVVNPWLAGKMRG